MTFSRRKEGAGRWGDIPGVSWSAILNHDVQSRSASADLDSNAAVLRRGFDGLTQNVDQHLLQAASVRRQDGQRTGQVQGQPVPWLPLRQPDRLDGFVKDRTQSDRLLVELDLLRLEPGHLKDVVDQSEQVLTAAVDDRGIFLAASTRRAENSILQDLAHAEYGVQGGPQFLADGGKEQRLRPARRFRRIAGGSQVVLSPFLVGDVVDASRKADRLSIRVPRRLGLDPDPAVTAVGSPETARGVIRLPFSQMSPKSSTRSWSSGCSRFLNVVPGTGSSSGVMPTMLLSSGDQ